MKLRFSIDDRLTPELNRVIGELRDTRPLMAAMGKRLEVNLRAHFTHRDAEGNKQGWPSRHFWARAVRDKTALTLVTDSLAVVTIDSPELAHKITGGTITPKRGKSLAMPANAQAYKLGSPRESGRDFQFLPLYQGNLVGALINPETYTIGKKKGKADGKMRGGEVMYWLVRSVNQPDDPNALPDEASLFAGVLQTARDYLARMLRRSG